MSLDAVKPAMRGPGLLVPGIPELRIPVAPLTERDRARSIEEILQELAAQEEHFDRWMEQPCSSIVHHDRACCEEARLWFLSFARSMEIGALAKFNVKAPTWLSQVFTWGPSKWPISWCELVEEDVIDCGVFAALAREIFRAQGLESYGAQAILSYNETCTNHWRDLWTGNKKKEKDAEKKRQKKEEEGEVFPWIGNRLVYHELCVVEMPDGKAKVYDSTWGNWYEPVQRVGFGAVLAIRTECPRLMQWGDKVISCGEWMSL